jgi:hypothetical protein
MPSSISYAKASKPMITCLAAKIVEISLVVFEQPESIALQPSRPIFVGLSAEECQ